MDFRNEAKNLFTSSTLEEKRVKTPQADPREIGVFKDLESIISGSFHKPASAPPTLMTRPFERTLQDQELLKKLIQYRNEIPLSSRIIRKKDV